MSLLAYVSGALGGALLGMITHEAIHYITAKLLARNVSVGWDGIIKPIVYVEYEAFSKVGSEIIRKSPLVAGLLCLVWVFASYNGPTVEWVAAASFTLGLLRASPQDLFAARAEASASA